MISSSDKFEYRFTCPLPNGLHARPANLLEQVVSGFGCNVVLENLSNNRVANAHSVLSLVGADVKEGDECILRLDGPDSEAAYKVLVKFIINELPSCDEKLPEVVCAAGDVYIPPVLQAAQAEYYLGTSVVAGLARGRVVHVQALALPDNLSSQLADEPQKEIELVGQAFAQLENEIALRLTSPLLTRMEKDILTAQQAIATDKEFRQKVVSLIAEQAISAGVAVMQAYEHFCDILRSARSELIKERVYDLQDISAQLLIHLYGSQPQAKVVLTAPSVCVADNITPSQFMSLDKSMVSAIVLAHGSSTSHTVILARSCGIPTLVGVKEACSCLKSGQDVIIDANNGLLIHKVNDKVERYFRSEQAMRAAREEYYSAFVDKDAQTIDGLPMLVSANIARAEEVAIAVAKGADSIGLFRTEMLFMDRDKAPAVEQQFEQYHEAVKAAGGRPVTIRTFDIGGDKNVSYLNLASEENPFLGYRGVRIYQQFNDMFRDQLTAILRASAYGPVKIMIPMVTCFEEVLWVRQTLDQVKLTLDNDHVAYDRNIRLGINVEVPAVGFIIPQLAGIIDFISLGTNDLTQYFTAVDRGNKQVSSLYQSEHPGFLKFIKYIVEQAHKSNLIVSMCGEMAGQLANLPILLGTGIDDLSVSIPSVLPIKAAVSGASASECSLLLDELVGLKSAIDVKERVVAFNNRPSDKSAVDVALVDLKADCVNKPEVIRHVCNMLAGDNRTGDAVELEKDFWRREAVYSTGLGFGIAVPHCKTSSVNCNSICVLKLKQAVEWESIDNMPVDVIIAMTIKDVEQAGNLHMKIFSRLARHIMHEKFRESLRTIESAQEIVEFLHEKLEIN
ncbi:MAG: phosphoenolpyruvate--protein phosphotransferase [Sedimentisphaerales bacterium]|nr:phosphoenolpyruvate--protein phosphotransferase [Sedimentisphaerales bacterium]